VSDFEDLDYYQLLGVSRSASPEEIKRAYRQEMSKYHPDRFANATPAEREYAIRRSQRITEAYSVLSDFAARSAYNRGQLLKGRAGMTRRPPPAPAQPRDHQAELYEQAREHLAAGRLVQAIGALRQLQQLNPFYRDSAALLEQAEAQVQARQRRHERASTARPLLIAGGLVGGLAAALAVWAIGMHSDTAGLTSASIHASAPVAVLATEMPTSPPEPTAALPAPSPTAAPPAPSPIAAPPTPSPIAAPPTPSPTTAPPPTPVGEGGALLVADDFSGSGWASLDGNGWRVGYQNGRYRITVDRGLGTIWSYRVGPDGNVSIGVDVQVPSGEGGLLLQFIDQNNYLSYSINPQQTSFRLEQHSGGGITVLAGGQSEAIHMGADAHNRLVARLRDAHLQLLANGQLLAELDLPAASGSTRYGLLAIAGDTAAEALFDNLEIHALE
jgi:DnaJ-domain-containing protein 1